MITKTNWQYNDIVTEGDLNRIEGNVKTLNTQQTEQQKLTTTLKRGPNLINSDVGGALRVRPPGRTQINILGKLGNGESLGGWTTGGSFAVSTEQKRSGNTSFKAVAAATGAYGYADIPYKLDTAKYYVLAGWVYISAFVSGNARFRLYDIGSLTTDRYTANANSSITGAWQFVYTKIPAGNTLVGDGFRLFVGMTVTSGNDITAYFDDIRLYELSLADYNAIGTTYTTGDAIDAFIPYVDSVQHLRGAAVRKPGKNLLPPFTEWTLNANASATEPYKLTLNASGANNASYVDIPVLPNQQYTFGVTFAAGATNYNFFDINKNVLTSNSYSGVNPKTFTTTAQTAYVRVYVTNGSTGTYLFSDPMFVFGGADQLPPSFEPRNDDYVYLPTVLASNVDRSIRDNAEQRDGQWWAFRRWVTGVVLDGSLSWAFHGDDTGFKRIRVDGLLAGTYTAGDGNLVQYDGFPLRRMASGGTWAAGMFQIGSANSTLYLSVADSLSGWTEDLNPNSNLVKILMNGWKANGNDGTTYNSWQSILDGSAPATNTSTYCLNNKAPGWTGWGVLDYVRASPVEEVIEGAEGAISLQAGPNVVELLEGVVVRETVTPSYYAAGNTYHINWRNDAGTVPPGSQLSRKVSVIVAIYKGSDLDASWIKVSDANAYGNMRAHIAAANFDPTAVYTVTFIVLDRYLYSANAIDATGQYPATLGAVVGQNSQDIADIQQEQGAQNWALDYIQAHTENNAIDLNDHKTAAVLDHPDGSVTAAKLANGSATDVKIGNRTVDQATGTAFGNTGTLTQLLSWIVKVLRAITGTTNWYDSPPATLTGLNTSLNNHTAATTGVHGATSAATANAIVTRDGSGRGKVAAPAASDDIAIKQTVDDHAALTAAHGATSAASASRLVLRDGAGRAQFADPSGAQDAATKVYVDNVANSRSGACVIDLLTTTYGENGVPVQPSSSIDIMDYRFLWHNALATGRNIYFEAIIKCQGTVPITCELRSASNTWAAVSHSATNAARIRSGPISLPDNTELYIRGSSSGSSGGNLLWARIIIV